MSYKIARCLLLVSNRSGFGVYSFNTTIQTMEIVSVNSVDQDETAHIHCLPPRLHFFLDLLFAIFSRFVYLPFLKQLILLKF